MNEKILNLILSQRGTITKEVPKALGVIAGAFAVSFTKSILDGYENARKEEKTTSIPTKKNSRKIDVKKMKEGR